MHRVLFRHNHHLKNRKGIYLIEFLVALGIFVIIVGALLTLTLDALRLRKQNTEWTQSSWYAQEGIEAMQSIALHGFGKLALGTYGLTFSGSTWNLTGAQDTQGNLERTVSVAWGKRNGSGDIDPTGTIDPYTKTATVTVKRSADGAQLNQTSFIQTMAMGKEWKETTVADFASGTFTNTQTAALGDGAVILGQTGQQTQGLHFQLNSVVNNLWIRSQTQKIAFRITPTLNQPITRIRVYVAAVNGTVPSYRIGLRATTGGGTPATTWLGTTNNGFGILASPFTAGWKTITLNEPVTIPSGQTVHLVIEWSSGTISTSRYAAFRVTNPRNPIDSTTGQPQIDLQTFTSTNGTTWTIPNSPTGYEPVFIVETAAPEYFGNVYSTTAATQIYGANLGIGQRFSVGAADMTIQGANFLVYKNNNNVPADSLHLAIRDLTTNTALVPNIVVVAANAVTTTPTWYTVTLPTPITAPANHVIRLELTSPGSASARHYRIQNHASVVTAPYPTITYQGTQSYLETKSGATWTPFTNADMPFELQIAGGYAPAGEYESSVFDTGSAITRYASLVWNGTAPVGTSISIRARTGATLVDLQNSPYVGPDGTSATFFTSLDTIPTPAGGTGSRFVQYRINLTGSQNTTPRVDDLTFLYEI